MNNYYDVSKFFQSIIFSLWFSLNVNTVVQQRSSFFKVITQFTEFSVLEAFSNKVKKDQVIVGNSIQFNSILFGQRKN